LTTGDLNYAWPPSSSGIGITVILGDKSHQNKEKMQYIKKILITPGGT
jgi:hypothetical protein